MCATVWTLTYLLLEPAAGPVSKCIMLQNSSNVHRASLQPVAICTAPRCACTSVMLHLMCVLQFNGHMC